MSSSLILGLLIGLAVGGPLYYAYLTFTKKRKHAARNRLIETMREEQAVREEQKEHVDQEVQAEQEVKSGMDEHKTQEGQEE